MDILLAENLKRLRAERGGSQDALATHLGVTSQAVSKWECGENFPDITLLPSIAAYYDASVDDLLGVGEIRKREKITAYMEQSIELNRLGKIKDALALWEAVYKEFPNEPAVMSNLAHALFAVSLNTGEPPELKARIVALCETPLDKGGYDEERMISYVDNATQTLVFALDDHEKAKKYAYRQGTYWTTREELLVNICTGDERLAQAQSNIRELADLLSGNICVVAYAQTDEKRKIAIYEFAIQLWDGIFSDNDHGFYFCRTSRLCEHIANAYARLGEFEKAFPYLERAAADSIAYETSGSFKRTSPLADTTHQGTDITMKNYTETDVELRIKNMETYEPYAPMRADPRFTSILDRLKKHSAA
ncbi:MAG: helix-turn-helix domain-containing protein [Oscillospiraceae bacterium]|jgi:transcriptional regulator with XRE-family HTH domain|nr:helix-turn-helix domain-containing protein [Oscillospiraceae bacterium]